MIEFIYDKEGWDDALESIEDFDFYHTYEYHSYFMSSSQIPLLIYFRDQQVEIAIPFIKRPVDSDNFDLTSVHGYLGPISKNICQNFDPAKFAAALRTFLKSQNIVSVFSKLNPFISNQDLILSELGGGIQVGELCYFDHSESDSEQLSKYNRNTRQKLRQIKERAEIRVVGNSKEKSAYLKLFYANLDRLKAARKFYFEEKYFKVLSECIYCNTEELIIVDKISGEIMAGGFLVKTNRIAHIELAFTNSKFFKSSPVRFIFDYSRQKTKSDQAEILNLGGGSGGRNGSLMRFKGSFSDNYVHFSVWKLIVDKDKYEALIKPEQKEEGTEFFPLYRYNAG